MKTNNNLFGYHCKKCEKNFFVDERLSEMEERFISCPRCKDFVHIISFDEIKDRVLTEIVKESIKKHQD